MLLRLVWHDLKSSGPDCLRNQWAVIGSLLLLETIGITNPRARTAAPEKSIVKILMQFYESVHEIP